MERENCWLRQPLSKNFFFSTRFFCIFLLFFRKFLIFLQQTSPSSSKHFFFSSNLRIKVQKQCFLVSSVRSSSSHPDPLLTQHHHPLFQITPVLNTGLSLSEPLQLYQRQSLDSSAGYMYTLWVQQDITAR